MKRMIIFSLLAILIIIGGCKKKSPEEALRESQMKIQRGDLIGARIDLKEIIRKYPNDPLITDARFLLAHCYFAERDFSQSRNHAQMIIDQFGPQDPRSKAAFQLILNTYNMEQKFAEGIKEAEKFSTKLSKDDDFDFELQCMIADLLVSDNNTTEAITRLKNLIAEGKDHKQKTEALERLVALYAAMKIYPEAIRTYEEYAKKNPDYENYYDLITGQAYFHVMMGDKDKAEEMYGKALKGYQEMADKTLDRSRKAELIFRQAKTLELQKQFDQAREKYDVIMSEYSDTPLSPHAMFAKGDSYLLESEPDKSLNFFQEQLKSLGENSPVLQGVRARIAGLMREQARLAASSGETTKTRELKPQIPK